MEERDTRSSSRNESSRAGSSQRTLNEEDLRIRRGIIASLRNGVAPARGTSLIEVGLADFWDDLYTDFIEITRGTHNGSIIYVMGEYGRGKTFLCNYTKEKAWSMWSRGFATSYVEVKGFESLADYLGIYRQIVTNIQLPTAEARGLEPLLSQFANRFPTRQDLNGELSRLALDPDIAQKIRYYYDYSRRGDDTACSIALRWMAGEGGIKADLLHMIDEKGFARLEEADVDSYLTGVKQLVKSLGYEGLFVFIDEAEERTAGFAETQVRAILRNIKKVHNSVSQDERFEQLIFVLAGTRDLWTKHYNLDEAQKQRMQIRRDLPVHSREDFIQLSEKVIRIYDDAMGTDLAWRIERPTLERWVDAMIFSRGRVELITPRDYLSALPSPDKSFMRKLDLLRTSPNMESSRAFAV